VRHFRQILGETSETRSSSSNPASSNNSPTGSAGKLALADPPLEKILLQVSAAADDDDEDDDDDVTGRKFELVGGSYKSSVTVALPVSSENGNWSNLPKPNWMISQC
jgi:hypothetical protein